MWINIFLPIFPSNLNLHGWVTKRFVVCMTKLYPGVDILRLSRLNKVNINLEPEISIQLRSRQQKHPNGF